MSNMQGSFHHRKFVALARRPFLLAIVFVAIGAGVAHACPTCSEGLAAADPHHQSIAAGICYSVMFMMSMPYLILATFGSMAYLSIKRAREQQALESGNGDDPQAN